MTKFPSCWCCKGQLEPAQQFRYLVETDSLSDPAYLARIRTLPAINGTPVPVCQACQARLERSNARPAPKSKVGEVLGTLGALSVGLLLTNLFTARG